MGLAVCVFCSSSSRIDQKFLDFSAEVGTELARRGHTLISGGGRVSCMGEVAKAVRRGGGRTVGIIPQSLVDLEIADIDADELIVTTGIRERKAIMDDRADAFLIIPGGIGTLEELFEIWTTRSLGLHSKPIAILDPYGIFTPLRALIAGLVEQGFARAHIVDLIHWTADVHQALDHLEKA